MSARAADIDRELLAARPPDPADSELREATSRVLRRLDERLGSVEGRLRAARPADPTTAESEEAAVRVLARMAMLGSGETRTPTRWTRRVFSGARVAAAILLAVAFTQMAPRDRQEEIPTPPHSEPAAMCDALTTCVEDAIGGDALARHRVLSEGPRARGVLLMRAEQSDEGAVEALGLLRALGGIRHDSEARRLRELARRDDTREVAIQLLAAAPLTAGARQLGALLAEDPAAESLAVQGLLSTAERGRRAAAFDALLEGAAAGSIDATVAALRVARATALERILAAVPPSTLEDGRVSSAVRSAPVTMRDRLLRRAVDGDERALRLAAAAGLDGLLPALRATAQGEDVRLARWAVGALARQATVDAWLALQDAQRGPAGSAAAQALARMPDDAVGALERRASREAVRRPELLATLAAVGSRGVAALERLSARPALRASVVEALTVAPAPEAVDVLARRARQSVDADRALVALAERLQRGDARAGEALLDLARQDGSRRALNLLERHAAAAGPSWVSRLLGDPSLPSAVREVLRGAGRTEPSPPRAEPVRAVRRPRARRKRSPVT